MVVHVDVTRFVTYEDPDGYVQLGPHRHEHRRRRGGLALVQSQAADILKGQAVKWSVSQLVGDPALALKHLADEVDARLIVVGTRKRGFGESVREFFTGSGGGPAGDCAIARDDA